MLERTSSSAVGATDPGITARPDEGSVAASSFQLNDEALDARSVDAHSRYPVHVEAVEVFDQSSSIRPSRWPAARLSLQQADHQLIVSDGAVGTGGVRGQGDALSIA
jgi:hypothetical protein